MNETRRTGSRNPEPRQAAPAPLPQKKKKSGLLGRIIRRFFLLVFTVILLAVVALCLVMNLVFNGPSPAARKILTMSLTEASATKWVPGLFMDDETVAEIRKSVNAPLPDDVTDVSQVVIQTGSLGAGSDEWVNYPDGIYVEDIQGKTFNAHIMLIQDPSRVYMATSTEKFSPSIPGKRITEVIETEGAVAAINAGAFFDDGTAGSSVGSYPLGLVVSQGKTVWESGQQPGLQGFAGFNEDHVLYVSSKNLTKKQAAEKKIRDGCCFGPALIVNGEVNMEAYNTASGFNPRTAVGQRRDGAVIFLCVDGRQAGSLGATYADIIDIMLEYGAYNACNMDGGSSSVMLYRDSYGRYGEAGQVRMMNSYSVIQAEPRKMPNFWMVRPGKEG